LRFAPSRHGHPRARRTPQCFRAVCQLITVTAQAEDTPDVCGSASPPAGVDHVRQISCHVLQSYSYERPDRRL
jgi:hypothetical protein